MGKNARRLRPLGRRGLAISMSVKSISSFGAGTLSQLLARLPGLLGLTTDLVEEARGDPKGKEE